MGKRTDRYDIELIAKLETEGFSFRKIAKRYNVSVNSVIGYLKRNYIKKIKYIKKQ